MAYNIVTDCPRRSVITPSNACKAGTTLTCTTDSYPAASYFWIDNLTGATKSGPTYVLSVGQYNLTCVAYMYANCTNGYYSPVAFPDTGATEGFPFGTMLNRTDTNFTMECSDNATIAGFAVGEYVYIFRFLFYFRFSHFKLRYRSKQQSQHVLPKQLLVQQ